MKINKLEIENVKRIKAVKIEPTKLEEKSKNEWI